MGAENHNNTADSVINFLVMVLESFKHSSPGFNRIVIPEEWGRLLVEGWNKRRHTDEQLEKIVKPKIRKKK